MLTRQKEFLQWIVGGVATSAFIVGTVWVSENRERVVAFAETLPSYLENGVSPRAPASVTPSAPADENKTGTKVEQLEHGMSTMARPEGKGGGHMQITFDAPADRQTPAGLFLDADIYAINELSDLKYEWVLPDGVSLVSGSVSGDLETVKAGDDTSIEATFSYPAIGNRQIVLHVFKMVNGEASGQTALYNTLDQNSIDTRLASKLELLEGGSDRKPASEKTTRVQ